MKLEFTKDQALVFFEWLSRLDDAEELRAQHEAEERVIWLLLGQLECALVEPFLPDHKNLLEQARTRVLQEVPE